MTFFANDNFLMEFLITFRAYKKAEFSPVLYHSKKMKTPLLWILLCFQSIESKSVIDSIIETFKKGGKVYCVVKILDNSIQEMEYSSSSLTPFYVLDMKSENLKEASLTCKHHILMVQDLTFLQYLQINELANSEGKFAIILQNAENNSNAEKLLSHQLFQNIIDLAVYVQKGYL